MRQDEQPPENRPLVEVGPRYGKVFRPRSSLEDPSQSLRISKQLTSAYTMPGRVSDRNHGGLVNQGGIRPDGGGDASTELGSGVGSRGRSSWPPRTTTSLSSHRLSSAYGGYVDLSMNDTRSVRNGETEVRDVKRVRRPTLMLASTLEGEGHSGEGSAEGEQEALEERRSPVGTSSPQSPVLVHLDAGRIEPIQLEGQFNMEVEEIPPTYDSLPTSQM
jgi:hypothetical protein